jgi:hypothetical protein
MIVEIAGINDDHQSVGLSLPIQLPQHNIPRDRLIQTVGLKAIGTGQINQFNRPTIGEGRTTRFAFHGDAGIIANFLPSPRQRIKQCRFASIGIADESNEGRCLAHASVSHIMASATFRRKATVIRPTRTAIGSRQNKMPLCKVST